MCTSSRPVLATTERDSELYTIVVVCMHVHVSVSVAVSVKGILLPVVFWNVGRNERRCEATAHCGEERAQAGERPGTEQGLTLVVFADTHVYLARL